MAEGWYGRLQSWRERLEESLKKNVYFWPFALVLELIWHRIYGNANEFLDVHGPAFLGKAVRYLPSDPIVLAILIAIFFVTSLGALSFFNIPKTEDNSSPRINPRFRDDFARLDPKFKLEAVMDTETIFIVAGETIACELLDRETCGVLRDSIDKRSGGRPFRRAVIVSAKTWQNSIWFTEKCPAISIGAEFCNELSQQILEVSKQKGIVPFPLGTGHGAYLAGPPPRAALFGVSAEDTKSAVEQYITATRGLAEFLDNCWIS
jgi:hypothetical protein